MSNSQHSASEYRTAINALRGFASVYVVLYHLRYYSDFDWFGTFPIIQFGYIGVDFFFILSGLIISHVYLRGSENASSDYWKKFVWYRVARLFPVHFLIMLMMLLAAIFVPAIAGRESSLVPADYWDWVLLATLIRQWTLPEAYAWNSPAWSVSAEFFAYLIIFPLVTRLAAGKMTRPMGLAILCAGSALLAALISGAGTVNIISYAGPIIRVTGGFLIGSGLYLILSAVNRDRDWDRILAYAFAALLLVFALAPILAERGVSVDILLIIALGLLTSMAYLAQGPIARWLSRPGLFWFGEVSFALYLCHIPVMRVCAALARHWEWERGFWFGCLCVVASFATAQALYRFVELPSRKIMRDWYNRYSASAKPSAIEA